MSSFHLISLKTRAKKYHSIFSEILFLGMSRYFLYIDGQFTIGGDVTRDY